jgi:ferredoxin
VHRWTLPGSLGWASTPVVPYSDAGPEVAPIRTWRSPLTYTIAEPCIDVKDKACVEECPVDCIYEGDRMLYIHPTECIDCGACEPVCPVEAIFYEDDVPDEWQQFTPINAEFFEDSVTGLGSPGGAAAVGAVAQDHPTVAAWEG